VAHPASYQMGNGGCFLGVKRPAREADHSVISSAQDKKAWTYTSTHPYVFVTWCLSTMYVFVTWYLVKHRDKVKLPLCLVKQRGKFTFYR